MDGVGDAFGGELVGEAGGVSEEQGSVLGDGLLGRASVADWVSLDLDHFCFGEAQVREVAVGLFANGAAPFWGGDDSDRELAVLGEDPAVAPGSIADIDVGGLMPVVECGARCGDLDFVGGTAGRGGVDVEPTGRRAGGAVGGEDVAGSDSSGRSFQFVTIVFLEE